MPNHPVQPYKHTLKQRLIEKPYVFASGVLFTVIGWLAVLYNPSWVLFDFIPLGEIFGFLVALMALPLWLMGTPLMLAGVNLSPHYHKVHHASKLLLMSPFLILLFFLSTQFVALGIYGFILGVGLWLSAKNIQRKTPHIAQVQQPSKRKKSAEGTPAVSLYADAAHLTLLLSRQGNAMLADVVDAINKLDAHLPYLQQHHAYLAASVSELINDLTDNSIHRLDRLASEFVHDGKVNADEKQLFAQQHDVQIQAMLSEHLDEINQLNQRILEKKMASFNDVGSSAESQFRNSVMELKILLRWFIAKTPDNQVSSHEVLLKRLEESTLKQMHAAFYHVDTTPAQKAALQQQVDDLIAHFKGQSPDASTNTKSTDDEPLLLAYSETQPLDFTSSETQAFIDFNAQYVKQLKQHW